MLTFAELIGRLRQMVVEEVRNGEWTERGLARRVGMSQSHIHNVLSGTRILTPPTADRIMQGLALSVLDLIQETDLTPGAENTPRD